MAVAPRLDPISRRRYQPRHTIEIEAWMAGRVAWFLIIASFTLSSGCAFNWTVKPDSEQPVSTPKKEQFGDLITAPGQRVPIGSTPAPLPNAIPNDPPRPIEPVSPQTIELPKRPQSEPISPSNTANPDSLFPSIIPQPHGPESPLLSATRAFQDGRVDFANEQLRWFSPINQAVLAKLLPAAARAAVGTIQDPKDASDLLGRIDAASDVVRPFAELKIDNLRLCDRAVDYGDYTPTTSFTSGKRVVVYYEIENLISEQITIPGSEPKFVVSFRAKVRIRGNGKTVEHFTGTFNRQWMRPVRDVFAANTIELPSQPGPYTVEIEVLDATGRRASRSIEFRVDERK